LAGQMTLAYLLFVLRCTEQGIHCISLGKLYLDEPTFPVRVRVNQRRIGVQSIIAIDDFATHRGVDVTDAFSGLNFANNLIAGNLRPRFRHLGVDDVPQGVLRKVGDANPNYTVGIGRGDPFVFCSVGKFFWNIAHWWPFIGTMTNLDGGRAAGHR
jgi:hypothetical protein